MKSFLNIMAADMLAHFGDDMRDVTVVFPGKRAGMFLSRELALMSDRPVWAPHYCTAGDLFQSLTPIKPADSLECVWRLYGVMREVLGADYTETIDEFWSWGEVLMEDFDDIDKHLADARAIFTNIADRERLKSLDYLDESQRETLRRFFGRFSLENSTRLQKKFLQTWSHMYDIYTGLREQLLAEGKLWEGALLRHATERMLADDSLVGKLLDGRRAVVFAGFNVLSGAEHTLMRLVQREGKARFYWDYDIYYTNPKSDNEAGYFMRQNLRDFPCAIREEEAFDCLNRLPGVTFIACQTDNAAARYVNTYINEGLRMESEEFPAAQEANTGNTTAAANTSLFFDSVGQGRAAKAQSTLHSSLSIVLCNESLISPVLHSIPEGVGDVNVTMGFPVSDTPVYGTVMALLKLQTEGYDADRGRFRYPFVQALRRQPLFELLREEDCLAFHGGSPAELVGWLGSLLRQMARHYARIEEPDIFEQLYGEVLFRIDRMLCQLRSQLSTLNSQLSTHTLRRLLQQMMKCARIPFHSEPDRGLQVMGMLETRCLDFSHILMLSVEEGSLPRDTRASSFIPEGLREAFGLTTQRHRIAVYAYYFYRLISRCEHLTCVYNESTSDGHQHEMSRFLRQMLAETDIPVRTLWLGSEPGLSPAPSPRVEKTAEVMRLLRHRYDQSLPGGEHITLSPSAINTYMACPMRFYLNHVLRVRREDDPQEGISADIIGTIFHDTAEFFYEWLMQRHGTDVITADMLREPKELVRMLHAAFDVCWFHPVKDFDRLPELRRRYQGAVAAGEYKGTTLIARDVLLRYLEQLIRYDARHAPFRIVGAEQERTIELGLGDYRIRIGGRVDRIDEMDGRLRIVDYKTGPAGLSGQGVKMENIVGLSKGHEPYYLQVLTYALAEMERGESPLPVQPVLFFPIKATSPDYSPSLIIDGVACDDFAARHAETFREGLREVVGDILNPEKPFACATDREACKYCKLGLICGKG